MSSLPDAPPEEVMHTTFPEQIVNGMDLANHRPGYFTQDETSGHSSHLVSQNTKNIREELHGAPSYAEPSQSAPDHMMHYHHDMWKINTTPPPHAQDAAYALTATKGTTTYRSDYSSSSDSRHGSHDNGSSVHFSDSHPLSSSSSFTPINQNRSTAPFPSPLGVSRSALWSSRRAT